MHHTTQSIFISDSIKSQSTDIQRGHFNDSYRVCCCLSTGGKSSILPPARLTDYLSYNGSLSCIHTYLWWAIIHSVFNLKTDFQLFCIYIILHLKDNLILLHPSLVHVMSDQAEHFDLCDHWQNIFMDKGNISGPEQAEGNSCMMLETFSHLWLVQKFRNATDYPL